MTETAFVLKALHEGLNIWGQNPSPCQTSNNLKFKPKKSDLRQLWRLHAMLLCSVWSVDTADPPLMSSASVAVSGRYLATIQGLQSLRTMSWRIKSIASIGRLQSRSRGLAVSSSSSPASPASPAPSSSLCLHKIALLHHIFRFYFSLFSWPYWFICNI